jgi:hypothetical protein
VIAERFGRYMPDGAANGNGNGAASAGGAL